MPNLMVVGDDMRKAIFLVVLTALTRAAFCQIDVGYMYHLRNAGEVYQNTLHDIRGDATTTAICLFHENARIHVVKQSFLGGDVYSMSISAVNWTLGGKTVYIKIDDALYCITANWSTAYGGNMESGTLMFTLDQNVFLKLVTATSLQIQYFREPLSIDKSVLDKAKQTF